MEFNDSVLIAAAIVTHAWVHRITTPPEVVNIVGWVFSILCTVLICSRFVQCG